MRKIFIYGEFININVALTTKNSTYIVVKHQKYMFINYL